MQGPVSHLVYCLHRARHRAAQLLPVALAALMLQPAANAQSGPPGQQDEKIPTLELAMDPALGSARFGAIQGEVDASGVRLAVGGLSILQPVLVSLISQDPGRDLKLSIYKSGWSAARRAGSTGKDGAVQFQFRTEGGMNILLEGPSQPAPFILAVVAGDEIRPPMKDVFTSAAAGAPHAAGSASPAGGGNLSLLLLVVAVAAGAALVAAVVWARGRRKGHD